MSASTDRSEQINELATALAKAQAEMENPEFDRENTFFNNAKYATLAAVRNAVIPSLSKNNLSFTQFPLYSDGLAGCRWLLMHSSGQWLAGELMLPTSKRDAQAAGSAVTYARRYTLQAVAGVAGEPDDDGNTATPPEEPPPENPNARRNQPRRPARQEQPPADPPPKEKPAAKSNRELLKELMQVVVKTHPEGSFNTLVSYLTAGDIKDSKLLKDAPDTTIDEILAALHKSVHEHGEQRTYELAAIAESPKPF